MSYLSLGFLGACLGLAVGIAAGFMLPPFFYQLSNPEVLKDGQWGMIYLASVPLGAIIGMIAGLCGGLFLASKKI